VSRVISSTSANQASRRLVEHRPLQLAVTLLACTLLNGCAVVGMKPAQRAATIEFGRSLSMYGQLLADETSNIRSEVKEMRVLALSLPNEGSAQLFSERRYTKLGEGLNEPRLEELIALGGGTEKFGSSLARVADLNSSTVEEKIFSSTAHNFVLVAGSLAEGLANVSVAAPAVNLVTFMSTDTYRRRLIARTLAEAEPTVRNAATLLENEFDPNAPASLLSVYSNTTIRLQNILESTNESASLSPEDRHLVARAYRVVARNRDHIQYVTSRQRQLAREMAHAYDILLASFSRKEVDLSDIERCSNDVFQTDLAFKSLR
jgi:hypothetical protein